MLLMFFFFLCVTLCWVNYGVGNLGIAIRRVFNIFFCHVR